MARAKRPWGVVAGPVVLGMGLVVFWGARSAMAMKEQVIDWSYQLEHSPQAVRMQMPDVPLVPPLFINNDNMGRIDMVVVQRSRPGAVDSLTIFAKVPERFRRRLENCELRLRVSSVDLHGYTHALRCTSETDGLLSFGHLKVIDSDMEIPLMVRAEDLPCDHDLVRGQVCGKTTARLRRELRAIQRDLAREARQVRVEVRTDAEEVRQDAEEARREAEQVRAEAQLIREQAQQIRQEVRAAVRSIR